MQEKLKLLAENRVLVSAGVVVVFICSVVYFLYALGFIKLPEGKQLVDSSTTSMPVVTGAAGLSDPSSTTKTALELNKALKNQQAAQQQAQLPTKAVTPSPTPSKAVTPTVTPTTAPTATTAPTPTTVSPTDTPTPSPSETPTPTPTPSNTPVPSP